MKLKTPALLVVTTLLTLAFLYYVYPGHYTYAPFHNTWFLGEKTDVFTGRVTIQILDLGAGKWHDYSN